MRTICVALVFALSTACSTSVIEVHVSTDGDSSGTGSVTEPVNSIHQALNIAEQHQLDKPDQASRIVIGGGTYFLDSTLVFNTSGLSSESRKMTIEGKAGEQVVISGGRRLTNWNTEGEIWTSRIDDITFVEQLFVNGERAVRARIPNGSDSPSRWYLQEVKVEKQTVEGPIEQVDLWIGDSLSNLDFTDNGNTEIVVFKDWATLRHQVVAFNQPNHWELRSPFALFEGNYNGLLAPYVSRFTCYFEGHQAFIDEAGEWAFDKKTQILYYKPFPNQKRDETEFVIPKLETILTVGGQSEHRVSNIEINNLHFKHAAYQLPGFGHDGRQACFFYSGSTGIPTHEAILPAAIRFEWAEACQMTQCTLSMTGGNGIYIAAGCREIDLSKISIRDIGGNGLMIGNAKDPGSESPALVQGITFSQGEVSRAGRHYDSAVGIWLGFCRECEVTQSEIFDLPYTGISVGWQWNPIQSSAGNNRIEENHIYKVMQRLGDGGGIYTLGFQPGSVIRGNTIHDILRSELNHASPNNGMFIDEGSKGYRVENNHIYRVAHTCIRGHRAAGVHLIGNRFEPGDLPAISHTPPYGRMIFANQDSTIVWPNPGWPAEWGYPDSITAFTMEKNQFVY